MSLKTKMRISNEEAKPLSSESPLALDSDDEDTTPTYRGRGLVGRLINLIPGVAGSRSRGENARYVHLYHAAPTLDTFEGSGDNGRLRHWRRSRRSGWLRFLRGTMVNVVIVILCLLGILHIILVVCGRKSLFWDLEEYRAQIPAWDKLDQSPLTYLQDPSRYNAPIPCASHNDYWRRTPLLDALYWGCTSVEADVWHFDDEDDLFVGHNTASLSRERTLANLYVDPLVKLLDSINADKTAQQGLFKTDPDQTLVLLIDFKTDGYELYPHVLQQLEPLRRKNYLSHWDGNTFISKPITVVGTGNAPFELILAQHNHRDVFFDAPLDAFWEQPETTSPPPNQKRTPTPGQGQTGIDGIRSLDDFNISNSYFASVSIKASIGYPWTGRFTSNQLETIRGQIQGAKRRGLKSRYWETPAWPTSFRNYVWEVLVSEGVDFLNVDDLKGAAALDWRGPVGHGWFDA